MTRASKTRKSVARSLCGSANARLPPTVPTERTRIGHVARHAGHERRRRARPPTARFGGRWWPRFDSAGHRRHAVEAWHALTSTRTRGRRSPPSECGAARCRRRRGPPRRRIRRARRLAERRRPAEIERADYRPRPSPRGEAAAELVECLLRLVLMMPCPRPRACRAPGLGADHSRAGPDRLAVDGHAHGDLPPTRGPRPRADSAR